MTGSVPTTGQEGEAHPPQRGRAADARPALPLPPLSFPSHYGETGICLIDVDPGLAMAHWEIDRADYELAQVQFGGQAREILRLYDVAFIVFDGANAHSWFDVEVAPMSGNWYIHLWQPGRSYIADVGLRGPDGRFVALARSNSLQMPPGAERHDGDWLWLYVDGDPRKRQRVDQDAAVPPARLDAPPRLPDVNIAGLSPEELMTNISRQDVVQFYNELSARTAFRGGTREDRST